MNSEVCILDDGRRVRFALKRRERDPYYLVSFRGLDGVRKELSTRELNKNRATDAAIVLVKEAFSPEVLPPKNPSWDQALEEMVRQMRANNLRQTSIDQYILVVQRLRDCFPDTHGPAKITAAMASRFKAERSEDGVSVRTLQRNLRNLNIVYNKWWTNECKILDDNPFAHVSLPKAERSMPRVLAHGEVESFFAWMLKRWRGWRLPILFLETKRLVGCRITELASAPTSDLRDGRLHFPADVTKGRKERAVKLPPAIYDELQASAGKKYVFEAFPAQLRLAFLARSWDRWAGMVSPDFEPSRFKKWLEREKRQYLKKNPSVKKFKLHNLRGTAMSKAKEAGIHFEDAAIAFGCNPDTMRKHHLELDEVAVTDRVMEAIQGNGKKADDTKPGADPRPES